MSTFSIETWIPQQWNQVVGNEDLVEHFREILRSMIAGDNKGLNTMILGPSRTGKTSTIKLFVQCLTCEALDTQTFNPCCRCGHCTRNVARLGEEGAFADLEFGNVHYIPFDCANADVSDVRDLVKRSCDYEGIRVIYLDEVHRLHRSNSHLEEMLLKVTEETNSMWIASSVSAETLEKMFQKRFVHICTQLPVNSDVLAIWLADRCQEWGITCDRAETLLLLAQKANLVPGDALQVLARAYKKSPRILTETLVQSHRFIT